LFSRHNLPNAQLFAGGKDFSFLISDGKSMQLIKNSESLWTGKLDGDEISELTFQKSADQFWILGKKSLYSLSVKDKKLIKKLDGQNFTCFDLVEKGTKIVIGTTDGYMLFNIQSGKSG